MREREAGTEKESEREKSNYGDWGKRERPGGGEGESERSVERVNSGV